jgi:hypothetical protein
MAVGVPATGMTYDWAWVGWALVGPAGCKPVSRKGLSGANPFRPTMYYHLEKLTDGVWLSTALLLQGDFHMHTKLLQKLRIQFGTDFRSKQVPNSHAEILIDKGFKVLVAPKELNELSDA